MSGDTLKRCYLRVFYEWFSRCQISDMGKNISKPLWILVTRCGGCLNTERWYRRASCVLSRCIWMRPETHKPYQEHTNLGTFVMPKFENFPKRFFGNFFSEMCFRMCRMCGDMVLASGMMYGRLTTVIKCQKSWNFRYFKAQMLFLAKFLLVKFEKNRRWVSFKLAVYF